MTTTKEPFVGMLEVIQSTRTQKIQQKAWTQLVEQGFPTRRDEQFQYLPLRQLYQSTFVPPKKNISQEVVDAHTLPECKGNCIVFTNGIFSPELTTVQKEIVVEDLAKASRTFSTFLNSQWDKFHDPFALLNIACFAEGAFFYLPPKTRVEKPIQILHLVDNKDEPMMITPHLQGFIGKTSQAEFVSTEVLVSGESSFTSALFNFTLEEGANVKWEEKVLSNRVKRWYFSSMHASLKRDSNFQSIHVTDGSKTVRHNYDVELLGENAEVSLNGVAMLQGKAEAHTNVHIEHKAPNCRSNQLFKNGVEDQGHSSFEGKIYVHQAAQQTEAFQLNNNLLLSDQAKADSKPNLEIFADDVKASHGATVGQLDQEQLFYLQARGFSSAEAKNLLVYGFCKEVIDLIKVESLHNELQLFAKQFLHPSKR